MKASVHIEAGVCGFETKAQAASDDDQHVTFNIETTCEKIALLIELINRNGPIDAFLEISSSDQSVILQIAEAALTGCCAGCVVPAGLFKALQVSAGLALPKDIHIALTKA